MSNTTPLPFAGKSALVTRATRNIGAEIGLTLSPFMKVVFEANKSRVSRGLLITH